MQVSRPAWYGSSALLRSLVLRFGVLASLLLSAALLVLSLLERQRMVITDAEHSRGLVASALAVDPRRLQAVRRRLSNRSWGLPFSERRRQGSG